ncbi:MAG: AraC family transcriptional regulator [Bacteroidota bacterium]
MTDYVKELHRINKICFSNRAQIERSVDVKRYLDRNFEKDINLDRLAHLNGTSKYHMIRIFKKYHGVTPRQYLIERRMIAAKKLLAQGKSVSETCYSIGFASVHSFSNLFKSKTGKSPSAYKRAIFDKLES